MLRKTKEVINDFVCLISHWKNKDEFNRMRNEHGQYSLEGFDRLKCIYIHIPKAAGTSINKALFGNYGGGHKSVRVYKRIFGPTLYKKYYKFTFVRNPYSRILSAYHFLKNGGFNENDYVWAKKNISEYDNFNKFVKEWINERNIWTYPHFKPQYSFVCDLDLIPEVDFIGKVETINEDFDKVCKNLNIKNRLSVYNKSEADNSKWQELYNRYSLDKIAEIYHHDFDIFNYQKVCR